MSRMWLLCRIHGSFCLMQWPSTNPGLPMIYEILRVWLGDSSDDELPQILCYLYFVIQPLTLSIDIEFDCIQSSHPTKSPCTQWRRMHCRWKSGGPLIWCLPWLRISVTKRKALVNLVRMCLKQRLLVSLWKMWLSTRNFVQCKTSSCHIRKWISLSEELRQKSIKFWMNKCGI